MQNSHSCWFLHCRSCYTNEGEAELCNVIRLKNFVVEVLLQFLVCIAKVIYYLYPRTSAWQRALLNKRPVRTNANHHRSLCFMLRKKFGMRFLFLLRSSRSPIVLLLQRISPFALRFPREALSSVLSTSVPMRVPNFCLVSPSFV